MFNTKYRIIENDNGKFNIQYKLFFWPRWQYIGNYAWDWFFYSEYEIKAKAHEAVYDLKYPNGNKFKPKLNIVWSD